MAKAKPKTEPEAKQELFKHSAAIQIENNITSLQRKTWNVLLWNAYDELPTKETHSIPVQKLIHLVGFDSHNQSYLKDATKAMLRCIVEWDILDKDGSPDWGATALLAQVRIQGGICTYAYSPELRQRLHNPRMYARLDLKLQRRFVSKYALALWESCADFLGAKRDYGETSWISLDEFRRLMGLEKGEYQDFRDLNKRVISCAIDEINRVSDYRLTVEYKRRGRKVTGLKFKMRRVAMLPEPNGEQASLFADLDDMPRIVKELKDAGLSTQDALEIWQQGFKFVDEAARPPDSGEDEEAAFMRYVREKIHLLKRRQASGKIDNSTGFLREAIKKNYANPEFDQEVKRQTLAEAQKAAQRRDAQKKQLERQLEDLKTARGEALGAVYGEIAAASPEVLETALPGIFEEQPFLRQSYRHDQSALENYRSSPALASMINRSLERHAPVRLQAVTEDNAARIAAVEGQIAALG